MIVESFKDSFHGRNNIQDKIELLMNQHDKIRYSLTLSYHVSILNSYSKYELS